jgi:hypothetical protein
MTTAKRSLICLRRILSFVSCFLFLFCSVDCLKVVSDPATSSYHIQDSNGKILFQGGDISVFVGGKWCVHKTGEVAFSSNAKNDDFWQLTAKDREDIQGVDSIFGPFQGTKVTWSCTVGTNSPQEVTIVTSYKNMHSGQAVLFQVQWPEGALNTTVAGSFQSSMAHYPSLRPSPKEIPNALSWHGSFTQSVRGFSEGSQGGPTVFFNASDPGLSTVIVGSPWRGNWKSFSAGQTKNWAGEAGYWSPGTSGRIVQVPPNYTQTILLYQASSGITATLDSWGRAMQQASKPAAGPQKLSDVTLEKIGYQTDNGAMYCFCKDTNCSQTLLEEIEYLKLLGIPMGYLSFQGAGASSGRGKAAPWCVDTWGVDGGLSDQYPMDLTSFQKALGLPLQLYVPYFCPSNPYFGNGSQWNSTPSDPSLPECNGFAFENVQPSQSKAFYDWFMAKGIDHAGMVSFESDFMNQNYNCVPEFVQHATAAETWQQGMARAALERNVTIQWCYASPTDILASLDMPAVTNFRVSFDFCYGRSWDIGESSLLVWALGAVPSKDTLWSTDNNRFAVPGCPWTADHEESAAELHVVLALMSNGPVGISDAIGKTNATLLKRIITMDGTLLKPSKPLTSIDSTFLDVSRPILASSSAASGDNDGGYVYGTYGLGFSWYFVSFLLTQAFHIKLRDFWPQVSREQPVPYTFAYRHFGDGVECVNGKDAVSSGCVTIVSVDSVEDSSRIVFVAPPAPSLDDGGRGYPPTVTAVWQPCPKSGWIMLGELDKYVSVSPVRFRYVECTKEGVSVSVTGAIGEAVVLTALRPSKSIDEATGGVKVRYTVVKKKVTIHRNEEATLHFIPYDDPANNASIS